MELMAAILAPKKIPSLVCTGAEAIPFCVHPFDGPRLSAQKASFGCCEMGHVMNGSPLPCDKAKVHTVLEVLLEAKVMQLRQAGRKHKPSLHFFNSLRHIFTKGLNFEDGGSTQASAAAYRPPQSFMDPKVAAAAKARRKIEAAKPGVERLKGLLGWTPADDADGKRTGYTLVFCASLANDAPALREMLTAGSSHMKEINMGLRSNHTDLAYMWKGLKPFGAAMIYAKWETCQVLLDARADPTAKTWNGMDSLFGSACIGNLHTTAKFLETFPDWNINRIDSLVNVNSPVVAALSLNQKKTILKYMLDTGTDLLYKDKWGQAHSLLCSACTNEDSDIEAATFLVEQGADVNGRWQPHDFKWRILGKGLEFLSNTASGKFRTIKELCMIPGASPLHFAAKRGDVDLVETLLKLRADLTLKNKQGETPMDVAMDFFGKASVPVPLKEALNPRRALLQTHRMTHAEVTSVADLPEANAQEPLEPQV